MSPFPCYFLLFTALTITPLVSIGDCETSIRKTESTATATNEVRSTQQKSDQIKRDAVIRLGDPSAVQYSYRGRGYLSNRFGMLNPGPGQIRKFPKKLMKKLRKGSSNRLRGSSRRKDYKKAGRTRVYFRNRFQNLKCRGRGYFGYRYPDGSFQRKCLLGGQYRNWVLPRYRYRYRYPTRARYPAYNNSASLLNPYSRYLSRFTLGVGDNVKKILVIM